MRKEADVGFTLIEALVALVVLTICVAWFYRGLDLSARGARAMERDAAALAIARQQIAAAASLARAADGERTGRAENGITWTTKSQLHQWPASAIPMSDLPPLLRIDVRVDWRDMPGRSPRSLTLTTFKRAAMSGDAP